MYKHTPTRARRAARGLRSEGIDPQYTHGGGTLYEMPIEQTTDQLVAHADKAVQHAQSVRKAHARKSKRGTKQRETDINVATEGIRAAMKPIRRQIARAPFGSQTPALERLREASQRLQRERRKLWKMKIKENNPAEDLVEEIAKGDIK